MNRLWSQLSARAGVAISGDQDRLLDRYLDLLLAANQRMNLTRIVDRSAAESHHVGDALTLLPFLPPGEFRLADVGSGGGIPGLPLAILRPDARIVLIEATGKKAAYLQQAVQELGLRNVSVINKRSEDAGRVAEFREKFDVACARAVATLDWLAEWCLPLLRIGGKVLAMKGPKAAEELPLAEHAISIVGGGRANVVPIELPGTSGHVIVQIDKLRKTPAAYPRPSTATRGKPLQ